MSRQLLYFAVLACTLSGRVFAMDPDLAQFLYTKQQQIRGFSDSADSPVPKIIWRFYDAAAVQDWDTVSNLFNRISAASQRYTQATNDAAITPALATAIWPAIAESDGACEQFHQWNSRWLHRYGTDIINSIPPGSIYFGGTDPGRFIISALCESQVSGKPFYTLTQNQLADAAYLDYLRAMYGKKITVPAAEDAQQAFASYAADAAQRQARGELKLGEVVNTVDGHIQVAGPVAVMQINGLLARKVFEDNPERNFFVEESMPVDWMYPYLAPHGLIFQLNSAPKNQITDAELLKDRQYWQKLADETIGPWLDQKTSLQQVCDFAGKYGLGQQLADYPGDKDFASNDEARQTYAKLRGAIAGLYAWRSANTSNPDERRRMYDAADFAFRQSFALCPSSSEAVFRYLDLLMTRQRTSDAMLVVKTVLRLAPDNGHMRDLLAQLEKYQ